MRATLPHLETMHEHNHVDPRRRHARHLLHEHLVRLHGRRLREEALHRRRQLPVTVSVGHPRGQRQSIHSGGIVRGGRGGGGKVGRRIQGSASKRPGTAAGGGFEGGWGGAVVRERRVAVLACHVALCGEDWVALWVLVEGEVLGGRKEWNKGRETERNDRVFCKRKTKSQSGPRTTPHLAAGSMNTSQL